ncbi:beta-mannosidase [Rhizoctonia solani AG-1 IB]|uniref:beta-mannosidase n=1 Tax=Thanatephorus cucumeris (strain AG1-IB / isolate 7/3/14) TaxID=1108050 RepID=A0A0B7FI32_THACB|nr:beta-mannosidase [Rhizoctonia solani AG-1 IB]
MGVPTSLPIHEGWSFTQVGELERGGKPATAKGEWIPTSTFPTSVHVELIKLGKIPDPYIGLNEWDVQWVGEADWAFSTSFQLQSKDLLDPNADIVFDGLDTYCTVQLNGKVILEANNMFLSYRVPVKELLVEGSNELLLTFPSTFVKGRELQEKHGKFGLWNGDSSRLHVRTAQYTYGWDWGPVLRTIGPWRPIRLETYAVRLSDVRIRQDVKEDLSAKLSVDLEVSDKSSDLSASVVLKSSTGTVIKKATDLALQNGQSVVQFEVAKGEVADKSGAQVAAYSQRIGIRRARVVEDPLEGQEGRTFLFEINNVRVFCGGSNWIPADNFLTTITPERYRAWLQLLVDGNQNMVRIWAGGIYEDDSFYDACDELGILVWQDFMFGCGQYPAYDSLVESVKLEAEDNVKRMRHHPSLVIWAGNNEDYQVAESLKLELDYDADPSQVDFRKTNFPARYIYEVILPEVVNRLSDTHYHRASPYSGYGKPTTDRTYGDIHQWNVWHGSQEPWHNWDILSGRFVSEFGMEGFPNIRTVDYWLGGNKDERHPQSRIMNNHNKADGFERRLELYLVENFKHAFDIESYVYYTQIMQAETLASAYRLWRREWRGKGKEYTSGALVWQINDCWPVTSWAIVDYFLRPKPAYFTIARELRPYTVGMTRKTIKTPLGPRSALYSSIETRLEIWGTNSTLESKNAVLEIHSFDVEGGGKLIDTQKLDVTLAPNSSTELWKGGLPGEGKRTRDSDPHNVIVVQARLLDTDSKVLARYSNWPEPFKFIHFPTPEQVGLKISTSKGEDPSETLVSLSTSIPIKGIILDTEGEDAKWSDQAIDLVPGDDQVVVVNGLKGRTVRARYLGDGSA